MESQKTMKAVQVEDFSKPLKLVEVPIPKITDNQVLVKLSYAPINPADLATTRGTYLATQKVPTPFTAGSEGSGTVVEVGKNLEGKFKAGDRVFYLTLGSWAEYAAIEGYSCHKLPDDAPIDVACCSFVNPMTAHLWLLEAQAEGHKCIVHTVGSSALGRMVIKVMKENGIKTINLVRNPDYIAELKEIGADHVLNTSDANFEKDFKTITEAEGCRKAFDAIGGSFPGKLVWLMPKKSNIKVYGALGSELKVDVDFWALLSQDSTVGGFWLPVRAKDYPPEVIGKGLQTVFAGLKGAYASKIQKVFKLDDIAEAVKFSEANGSKGKVLLSADGN